MHGSGLGSGADVDTEPYYEEHELDIVSFPQLSHVCKFGFQSRLGNLPGKACHSCHCTRLGRTVLPKVTRSRRYCLLVFWSQRSAAQSLHDLVQHLSICCPRGHHVWTQSKIHSKSVHPILHHMLAFKINEIMNSCIIFLAYKLLAHAVKFYNETSQSIAD